ncbi:MAG: RNA polymerase sigma factor SigZ [Acidobacteriota bacterium]
MSLSTEGVWTELHANLRSFVARRVREHADVDDIVQRVFLQVHRALPTLRDTDKLHAWIYQTTRRAIADFYRSPSHHREVATGSADDFADALAAVDAEEAEESAAHELSACLRPLIKSLAAADQQALQMVEFDGVTQVEAAARLGLSVSGMKSRVQRARSHLRVALDDCCRIALDRRGGVISYQARTWSCGSCGSGPDSNSGCS